jgi:hypothetical protein
LVWVVGAAARLPKKKMRRGQGFVLDLKFRNFLQSKFMNLALKTVLVSVGVVMVAGCASEPPAANAAAAKASAKDERCYVTGSNVPKRNCTGDVTVLPPEAVEVVMPVLQGRGGPPPTR